MNNDSNDLSLLSFSPEFSSDEVCFGEDATLCLTDVVNGKADIGHTHTEYALTNHTHDDYASSEDLTTLEDVVDTKANANHTHSGYALTNHSHSEYTTQAELDTLSEEVSGKADITHSHTEYALSNHTHDDYALSSHSHSEYSTINHDHDEDYSAINHTHDDYATLTSLNEVSATVANKANTSHTHNDIYYTEAEIDTKLSAKANTSHTHTGTYDMDGAAADALISANAYTDSKINALIGEGASVTLDTIGEIASAIEDNQDAIDLLNSAIANKASTTDLNSHASNTEIHVTESEKISWNAKSDFSGNYNDLTNKPNIPSIGGLATEDYVNTQINAIDIPIALSELATDSTHRTVTDAEKTAWNAKSDFSGSYNDLTDKPSIPSVSGLATETYVDEAVNAKANTIHSHTIADVTGLQSALDGKAVSNHNHNDVYYTETEVNSLLLNKADSTHTHDSSYDALGTADTKANAVQANLNVVSSDLEEHIEDADIHFTAVERTKLSGIATGANNYAHPNSGVTAGTYKSVTVNAQGHVTAGSNPTTLAGYGITDADAKGSANSALVSAKEYADELVAEEVTNRNSAISTAKSSAISTASSDATTKANNALASARSYTDSKVAALVDSAPETMDTLKYVHDDCIKGSYQNASGDRNDVVLRAVYEY